MEEGGAGGQLVNEADNWPGRVTQESQCKYYSNWPCGRTGVNCKKLDNLSYEQIDLHFIFIFVTLYQEEGHHQHLLFFVGVPGAGFLWLLFGVETGD